MHRNPFARIIRLSSPVVRSFSVSSVLSQKSIDLTHFRKPQGEGLHPTSKWHLDWVEPICDMVFKTGLGFPKDNLDTIDLFPAERVFAECPARRDDIFKGEWKLDLKGVPHEGLWQVKDYVDDTFVKLQQVLRQHTIPETRVVSEASEKFPDVLAMQLIILCGFNSKGFTITCQPIDFKFAGMPINSEADVYVAKRHSEASDQIVFIWEDKLSKDKTGKLKVTEGMLERSAAQIIGEMISAHYRNKTKKYKPCEVYAVRLIDHMVAFFKLEMTAAQIEDVCEKGVIPETKLQVSTCLSPPPPPPLGILCGRVKKTRLLAKNSPKTRLFLGGEFWRVFFLGRDFTLGKMYTRKYEGNLSFEEKIFFVPLEQDLYSLLCRLPQPVPPVSFCGSMKLAQMGAM